ncbi:RagB/SusD family nutrient uptake outer membrane protein [Sphingobacterium faecium]|uniref:RagB/SusD family nutrient uptake outer membrane protein n=1 Tax=Sphingobacterium faecium TaxID=34087 RepID=UPI0024697035|nr:RagB/SusD family nutrient uptake outer membrane protein [Sphingobacterium faecium]MDH5827774.1 RagB/SusD family nutrient uptake outer membrane protein [Sphingobacterium faecium]
MKIYISICSVYAMLAFCCCTNFLEVKPDIKMVIPKSLQDAELLLNDYATMNTGYPIYGEWSADEYYITAETFDARLDFDLRNTYTWMDIIYDDVSQWQRPYRTVFNANQVIEIIDKGKVDNNTAKAKSLLGVAHFFRAFAFQQLVEVFAPAYQVTTASTEMGIPLRLSPDMDEPSTRASVQETYNQIVQDYKEASYRLPIDEGIKGRPFQASAYAGLARTYLVMGKFEEAYAYADSCLQLNRDLMDFNDLKSGNSLPIARFNIEVLFAAISATSGPMNLNYGLVDSTLYKSYAPTDLRKTIFFRANTYPLDSYGYKGSYDNGMANLFVGLTTSEVYFIKAEAAVRIGKIDAALTALNTLGVSRYERDKYVAVTERNPASLLSLILKERQKELVFRGRRWSDLKRLNLDPRFQKTLKREIHGIVYQLEPNSRKYAYRIPEIVVNNGKIPQNIR